MGRRASNILEIVIESGLIGLLIVVSAILGVTYAIANTIDKDEHAVAAVGLLATSCVASYRVWSASEKVKESRKDAEVETEEDAQSGE